MPIAQTFEKAEDAPEFIRPALVEKDGKFVFEAETAAEVGTLKGALKKERDSRAKYEGEIKKFEKFKPLIEADEEEVGQFFDAWSKRAEKSGKPDEKTVEMERKIQERAQKKLADELGLTKGELQKAQAELKDFKLWTPLREVFIKAGGDPADWEVARLELSHRGQFGFDDEGKIVVLEDGHPSTVSPDKFFKDVYSEARPKFYKASAAAGSGAQNNTSGSGRTFSISRAQAKDPATYRAAKDKADKAGVALTIND